LCRPAPCLATTADLAVIAITLFGFRCRGDVNLVGLPGGPPEILDPPTQSFADFRQLASTEHDQDDHEYDYELGNTQSEHLYLQAAAAA